MERRSRESKVRLEKREDKPARVEGYAAVYYDGTPETEYELWDDVRERIMPGAFDRAVKEGDDARALFNHDSNQVLGRVSAKTLRLENDKKGLRYEIDLGGGPVAQSVAEMLERGDVSGSSFAFVVTDQEWRTENEIDIREIRGVQLFDVGPVTFPAYEGTSAEIARKSAGGDEARTAWESWRESRKKDEDEIEAQRLRRLRRARLVELDASGSGR